MPPRLPVDKQADLQYLLFETDYSIAFIRRSTGVHRSTIYRLRLSWELFGTPYPPPCVLRSRPPILTDHRISWLLAYLTDRPDAYLDKMAWYLYDAFGIHVMESTLWKTLQRVG